MMFHKRIESQSWRILAGLALFSSLVGANNENAIAFRSLEGFSSGQGTPMDLNDYSLQFEKCQYVRSYNDEAAQDANYESALAVQHFVIVNLCPAHSCSKTCSSPFGQYVVPLETYLEYTLPAQEAALEDLCGNCDVGDADCGEDGSGCSGCAKVCYRYQKDDGYVDAANYIACQKLNMDGDDQGDAEEEDGQDDENNNGQQQLYIGPRCSQDGNRILIGLFKDAYCYEPYTDEEPSDYLGAEISYHLLSHTNSNAQVCLPCQGNNNNNNDGGGNNQGGNGDDDGYEDALEMCQSVHAIAGKCETPHGLSAGFQQTNQYYNQEETEFMTCAYIDSLVWNTYTETGEINLQGVMGVYVRPVTQTQKYVLSGLAVALLSVVGLLVWFRRKVQKVEEAKENKMPFLTSAEGTEDRPVL